MRTVKANTHILLISLSIATFFDVALAPNVDVTQVTSCIFMTSFDRLAAILFRTVRKMSVQQRSAIKFCVLNGISRKDTITMLQTAYGIAAMKKTQVYDWYRRFKNGQDKVTDEHRSGRPASLASRHIAEIKSFLANDRRITIREIVDRVDCSIGTVHDILHNKLNMRRVCARWIPKMLTEEQKRQKVECCLRLVERFEREGDAFLKRIVTVDETWISLYEPETKEQSTMWKTPGSPSPKKFKVSPSKKKQMFIVFFDARGVILSHAVPQGRTVTSQYYAKVLSRDFMRAMRKKRGEELPTMILHHDNAPAHRAATTQQIISKLSIEMLVHPPYSPDLAPCDFFLFPVLKKALRGHQFGDIDLLPTAVQSAISTIPNESYSNSFNAWVKRCRKCISFRGEYFEKD